jgi:hypothetical protein
MMLQAALTEGETATSEGMADHMTVRRTSSVSRKHLSVLAEEPVRIVKFKKINTS